jgi:hypothetical protein
MCFCAVRSRLPAPVDTGSTVYKGWVDSGHNRTSGCLPVTRTFEERVLGVAAPFHCYTTSGATDEPLVSVCPPDNFARPRSAPAGRCPHAGLCVLGHSG